MRKKAQKAAAAVAAEPKFDVQTDGRGVAVLTVRNEEKLNILSGGQMRDLTAAVKILSRRKDIRVLVLTGEGHRAFIGGADIRDMSKLKTASARVFITGLHRLCDSLRTFPVPVVARISGYCIGAGLEVAASCDLRVADETARFSMPEVKVGIPSVIEAALLPSLIGWGRTRDLLYTGRMIDAVTAHAWGLVDRLAGSGGIEIETEQLVGEILDCGPQAIRDQKALIRQWEKLPLKKAVEAGIRSFGGAFRTSEPTDRMRAFLERKKPA